MSRFQTARWSLLASATDTPAHARPALEYLCRAYRPPVVAYIRHCGHAPADAEDLAQAFFLRFLERAWYAVADPQRGRFRNLLLTSLRHFLADERDRVAALKRGGDMSSDAVGLEHLVDQGATPDEAFDRAWLGTVLAHAMSRLQREWQLAGKQAQFDQLAALLVQGPDPRELKQLAEMVGLRSNTLAVQVHRMRARLRQLVRLELLQTVDSRESLETELAELRDVLESSA